MLRGLEGKAMKSLGKRSNGARARTVACARRSFSALVVAALAAGLTAVGGAGAAGAAATHLAAHHRAAASPGSPSDETTISQGDLRNGWDPNEPTLTPAAVQGGQFGQIFKTPVNGQVYAQPLLVGNTLIVATENDWVYGLDATTGAILGHPARHALPHHHLQRPRPQHRGHLHRGLRPHDEHRVRHGPGP